MKGLMWFDNTAGKPVLQKVIEAAGRFFERWGEWPGVCYVHAGEAPAQQEALPFRVDGVRWVLPNHVLAFPGEVEGG